MGSMGRMGYEIRIMASGEKDRLQLECLTMCPGCLLAAITIVARSACCRVILLHLSTITRPSELCTSLGLNQRPAK